ncbi:hypothetical protein GT354_05520, partial [Streptomyces sp. SID3343]|nr:hypothetical protein [Streptomyces sp. SID3343]
DIVTGRRRVPLADARPWPDPDLENLIEDTMALDPSARGLGRVDVTPVADLHTRP